MNDVIVIGGGPAGSTVGSYLAKAGLKTTILETLNHPRAHVGESLVMSTYRIFKDIGFLEVMENESFVKKYGASWHSPNGKEFKAPFNQFDQEGIPQYYTWHVDRSKFDLYLLKQAEKLGAQVYQGVHVKQVLMENDRAVGVRVSIAGSEVDIPAKFVVDASGRGTLLGNQLKIKVKDPVFDQYAVHAWYKNVDRGEDDSVDFIHIYFLPIERGWVWQIPITDEITSMGVVADKKVFRDNYNDLESYFYANMKTNPRLEQAMGSAVRINEWKTEGDYSYCMSKFVGNNWLLVGDAARFVDPIFSSGVSVALYSARFASQAIVKAFESGDFSEAGLKHYETTIRSGVEVWYEFIRLYYKLLPLFTHFTQHPKHRVEIMKLLQGEVFDRGDVKVLDAMRDYIEAVEKSETHLLKGQMTDIRIDTSLEEEILTSSSTD